MKKIFLSLFLLSQVHAKAQDPSVADTTGAYKFILDYAVPASPAFNMLDVTPQQVMRGSAAKPLVLNAFTNFLQTGRLDPGIAADFSPYLLLGGGFQNLDEYRKSYLKRMLANSMLSLAAIKNSKDSSNTDFAVGGRVTFFDDHDLFSNKSIAKSITNKIGTALADASKSPIVAGQVPDEEVGTDGNITKTVSVDLSRFYTDAYNAIKKTKGWALSAGYGFRATVLSYTAQPDSLVNKQSKCWMSGTRYTTGGFDIYGTVQGTFNDSTKSRWVTGLAIGSKNKLSNAGAELLYDFTLKQWNYGANFEIRILKQLSYIISFNKASFLVNGVDVGSKFRIISNLRLDLFGH